MVSTSFDFTTAHFSSLTTLDASELEQADWVQIRGYVPGGIYHSLAMTWTGSLSDIGAPEKMIRSNKERKAVLKNKEKFEKQGNRFEVVPVTEELFREFRRLYEQTTLNRSRAIAYDVDGILAKIRAGVPTYFVAMFEGATLGSALAFSVKKNKASVSFGAKHKYAHIRGGVGGVLELELVRYCLEQGISEIGHGRSPNPAGLTGSSGIFEFKTRYGYTALPADYWVTSFIKNPAIALSDLVFVTALENQLGYLVISDRPEKEVRKRYQTREIGLVKVLTTEQVKDQYQELLKPLK